MLAWTVLFNFASIPGMSFLKCARARARPVRDEVDHHHGVPSCFIKTIRVISASSSLCNSSLY
jgi:hypothetical protein